MQRNTAIVFDPSLETGHAEIDDQHRELFWRIDRLLDASSQHRGAREVGRTLAFLADYVVQHFAVEVELMTARGYPALEEHREQHARFVEELAAIQRDFQAHGPSTPLVIRAGTQLTAWLRDHIQKTDRALVTWLQDARAASTPPALRPAPPRRSGAQ